MLPSGSQQLHWPKNDQYWIYNWPQNRLYCRRGSERPAAHLTKIDPSTPTQCFIHFFLYPSKSFENVANECYWHLKVKKCNPNSFIWKYKSTSSGFLTERKNVFFFFQKEDRCTSLICIWISKLKKHLILKWRKSGNEWFSDE